MINLKEAYENWMQLNYLISDIKDLNTFIELILDNPDFEITNDLRYSDNLIDINYKNICATIEQVDKNTLSLLPDIEIWEDLNMLSLNIDTYGQYKTSVVLDKTIKIDNIINKFYNGRKYYYAVNNDIYRNGRFITKVSYNTGNEVLSNTDKIIFNLIHLNKMLGSIDKLVDKIKSSNL